jgi:hypothetical protein
LLLFAWLHIPGHQGMMCARLSADAGDARSMLRMASRRPTALEGSRREEARGGVRAGTAPRWCTAVFTGKRASKPCFSCDGSGVGWAGASGEEEVRRERRAWRLAAGAAPATSVRTWKVAAAPRITSRQAQGQAMLLDAQQGDRAPGFFAACIGAEGRWTRGRGSCAPSSTVGSIPPPCAPSCCRLLCLS